jgi:hypothetical protein
MALRVVMSAPCDELAALTAFNRPVFQAHDELIRCVTQWQGTQTASVFARPSLVGTQLQWSTDLPGDIVQAGRISKPERAAFQAECNRIGEALSALVLELAKSGVNTRSGNLAEILRAALVVPAPAFLFIVGGKPVLTFWGFTTQDGTSLQALSGKLFDVPPATRTRIARPVPLAPVERKGRRHGRAVLWLCVSATILLALFQCEMGTRSAHREAATAHSFGSAQWMSAALQGSIFFIPPGTDRLPDLDALKPVGSIYTRMLDIPPRDFRAGFPGVTDRFEWFALRYAGTIEVSQPQTYVFRVVSDDGSRVYIDGHQIIDDDGVHPATARQAAIVLTPGLHDLRLDYFQGPRTMLALQLSCAVQGRPFQPFPDCGLLCIRRAVTCGVGCFVLRSLLAFSDGFGTRSGEHRGWRCGRA